MNTICIENDLLEENEEVISLKDEESTIFTELDRMIDELIYGCNDPYDE